VLIVGAVGRGSPGLYTTAPPRPKRLSAGIDFKLNLVRSRVLSHPSVIQVFDYGVDEQGPYYTMELLDGEDLRTAWSLSHEQICSVLYDVASCLSLLHARRLLHRDVTAANIRIIAGARALRVREKKREGTKHSCV
jgi:serine/threonine-protein kinase